MEKGNEKQIKKSTTGTKNTKNMKSKGIKDIKVFFFDSKECKFCEPVKVKLKLLLRDIPKTELVIVNSDDTNNREKFNIEYYPTTIFLKYSLCSWLEDFPYIEIPHTRIMGNIPNEELIKHWKLVRLMEKKYWDS